MSVRNTVLAAFAGVIALGGQAFGQTVTIGTNPQGALFYSMGSAIAKVVSEKTGKQYRVAPFAGSSTFIPMINQGRLDFGLANGGEAAFAHKGEGVFDGLANPNIRMVGVAFPTQTSFAVAAGSPFRSLADLKGAKIASGYASGRIFHYYTDAALASGGLTQDDFKKVPMPNFVSAINALSQGKIDAALIPMNVGVGKKAMAEMSGGWRYLSLGDEAGAAEAVSKALPSGRIVAKSPSKALTGVVDDPTRMIEVDFFVIVGAHVSEDTVYELTKVMYENKPDLAAAFGAFNRFAPKSMHEANPVPYHPGALKFYKEVGLVK
tara:strand:+ start:5433 stop:6395 length:963 start_codon:yes stop_codon:yes gene_type:complete